MFPPSSQPRPEPDPRDAFGHQSWDEALASLEDVLHGYAYDRVLPDLATILGDAGVSEDFLRSDERAIKVLHEAIVARPLASVDAVGELRTEVELLTLEVSVLADRLADDATSTEEAARATGRLGEVRRTLDQLRRHL